MEWLKKVLCSIWFYVILILASLIAPFVINELYKYGQANNVGYITLWEAKDVLAFLGSYLSFFGTIILGAVAVFQTDRANKLAEKANEQTTTANELARDALRQSEKSNELSLQMHKLEQARFYSVVSLGSLMISKRGIDSPFYKNPKIPNPKLFNLVVEETQCTSCYHLDFIVNNESEFPINVMTVKCTGRYESISYGVKSVLNTIYIAPKNTHSIRLIIPATYFVKYNEYRVNIDITYQNVFGYKTHVFLTVDDISNEYNPTYEYHIKSIDNMANIVNDDE